MITNLAKRLKCLRIQRNFTQKQVANSINVSPSIVSGYETGERTPSVDVLLSLAHLYHCSTDYLLGKDKFNLNNYIDATGLSQEQVKAINDLIKSITR